MTINVTNENVNEVLTTKKITILDFLASWCGPCQQLSPIMETLSDENSDITIGKVNIEEESEIAKRYQIRSIPTIIFFKEGKEVERLIGSYNKKKYQDIINDLK